VRGTVFRTLLLPRETAGEGRWPIWGMRSNLTHVICHHPLFFLKLPILSGSRRIVVPDGQAEYQQAQLLYLMYCIWRKKWVKLLLSNL
jgi:hypothetical protein